MNIVIIGPHPDDQELGMGGTIAKLAHQGHQVTLLDMTDGSPTPYGDRNTRLTESIAAAAALSPSPSPPQTLHPVTRILLDLPNRRVEHSIQARHKVAGVYRAVQADVVFMPYPEDAHPDHIACTRIAEDARFDAKLTKVDMPVPPGWIHVGPPVYPKWIIYYYCSHLRSVPSPSFIMDTAGYETKKREAILAYKTQFVDNPKNTRVLDWIQAQDVYMGSRIGTARGEAFWMREPLGLANLNVLA